MPPLIVGLAILAVGIAAAPATIASILIGIGSSLVLGSVSRALIKKPKASNFLYDAGSRTVSVRQPAPPWRVIYGACRVGGIFSFLHVTGTKGEFFHIIYTLAGHQLNSIGTMYFDGVAVPLDGSGDATGTYAGYVHAVKHTGDPADSAQPFPDLQTAAPTQWTANHLQRARAKVWVRFKWNQDLFPNGLPNVTFDVQGRKVYDPRGPTTAYSNLAALCINDYLTNVTFGPKVDYATKIDETQLIAAANTCDEAVALKAGGTEDRYTINGMFETSEPPRDVLNQMGFAMAGRVVYAGGKWFIHAGSYLTPAVDIAEGDLRGPIKVRTRLSRREMFNGVKGLYLSAANDWQPSDFPTVDGAAYLAQDGNVRAWKDIGMAFTTSIATAQRIGKIELERARRQFTVELPCGLAMYQVQPPEVVRVSNTRFTWTSKTFEVVKSALEVFEDDEGAPAVGTLLTLRETDASVFSWTPATDEKDANTPPALTFPDTKIVAPPTGLALNSGATTALLRTDGVRITRIKATWTAPADEFVTSGGRIVFQYKKSADATWLPAGPAPGASVEHYIAGVYDGVDYDVRCWAVNAVGAKSTTASVTNHTVSGPIAVSANTSYRPLSNPLTASDVGASATINIAAFTMRSAGVDLSINSGAVSSLSFDTLYYVYYTDSDFNGGTVTFSAATTKEDALNGVARFFVGSIVTPKDGGSDTIGNDDGGSLAQGGMTTYYYYSTNTPLTGGNGAIVSGANANDRNTSTKASLSVTANEAANNAQITLKLTTPPEVVGGKYKSAKVKVRTAVPTNDSDGGTNVVYVSKDSDYFYQLAPGSTRALQVDSLDLAGERIPSPETQVRFQVQTGAEHTSGDIILEVYEAWIEVVI
ncbi:MAG TPA: hypothetical protein VMX97_16595 [Hyphomicrobiaceae bacterium]|nr:hypothetical protein [Hyphomicrobiaceae bacterium]